MDVIVLGLLLTVAVLAIVKFHSIEKHPPLSPFDAYFKPVLINIGVSPEECEDCMRWALGDNWQSISLNMTDDVWRQLHPDKEPIYGHTAIDEGTEIIGREYLKLKTEYRV